MPDARQIVVRVLPSLSDVDAPAWDRCAGRDNPFVSYDFLSAMERSGTADGGAGWLPHHLVAEDAEGRLLGAIPLYLKSHSFGEYVFDYGWADAYQRAGGDYYPKFQAAVPYTPVPGPRLLVAPGQRAVRMPLWEAAVAVAERAGVSSLHVTFCQEEEHRELLSLGLLGRLGQQFHWHNRGYSSFRDFLSQLSSRKRKAIRRERRGAASHGLKFDVLQGSDLGEAHWDVFFEFYLDTCTRKWGRPYLNRRFFSLLGEGMGDRVVLILARDGRGYVAGALHLLGDRALFGRNWGSHGHFQFLHFELCYYQAIEFAIHHGLERVEAGAQGAHKIQRGYVPVPTYSAHWIRDPGFRRAVARFLQEERRMVRDDLRELAALAPYRSNGGLKQ